MVQVRSSWFPVTDQIRRNFSISRMRGPTDFLKATERIYWGGVDGSKIEVPLMP